VTIIRLTGGLTPGDGSDPRTFPEIFNAAADVIEAQGSAIAGLEDLNPVQFGTAVASDGQVLTFSNAVSAYVPEDPTGGVEPGAVMSFAMNTAPTGWLKANGATISRSTYADLFSAIGTTFGAGDGSTTFRLPDLRGEFLRGWDDGRGVDSGRTFGTEQTSQNLSHTHVLRWGNLFPATNQPGYLAFRTTNEYATAQSNSLPADWMQSSGGTEARPRNVALLYCIKF
jgi:microcystin-dependent protein